MLPDLPPAEKLHIWSSARAVCVRCGRTRGEIVDLDKGLLDLQVCHGPASPALWALPLERQVS